MTTAETVRFYVKCPRCGALPGKRCRPVDPRAQEQERSNHPARRRRYTEIKRDLMRGEELAQEHGW